MCLKIYATEQIEKKGRVSMEEIFKGIKEEEEIHQPTPKINGNTHINNNTNNTNINNNHKLIKDWDVIDKKDVENKVENTYPNQNKNDTKVDPNKKKRRGCVIF